MKMIIIKILVVLVAIVSVACVVAMFTKDKYTLQRDITINKPVNTVFNFIRYNRNQKLYSVWLSLDPATSINITGAEDGNPGSVLSFASKNHKTGTGEWEIKKVIPGQRMDFELRFLAPFAFTANGYFTTVPVSANQTKLSWVYNSGMDWPKNFMLLFMDMDKIVGNDVATSLENIKRTVEK